MKNLFPTIYSKQDLFAQLSAMGAPRKSIVLMHSSLRSVGKIEGGAKGLLDVLIEYFTQEGGLFCIPTHTWRNLKEETVLNMADSTTSLGALSTLAIEDGRGIRSENPTHSMVVFGDRKKAEAFIAGESKVSSGTAPESCYGKLCHEGGWILLVGVAHNKNTYLHCVEEMLHTPNRLSKEKRTVRIKRLSGEILKREIYTHSTDYTGDISARFPQYEPAFRYHHAITDGFIGRAPTQLCNAVIMKEVMERILARCGGDPLDTEQALPPKWYTD